MCSGISMYLAQVTALKAYSTVTHIATVQGMAHFYMCKMSDYNLKIPVFFFQIKMSMCSENSVLV